MLDGFRLCHFPQARETYVTSQEVEQTESRGWSKIDKMQDDGNGGRLLVRYSEKNQACTCCRVKGSGRAAGSWHR